MVAMIIKIITYFYNNDCIVLDILKTWYKKTR